MTPSNTHATPYAGARNRTLVSTHGMAVDDFTDRDAAAVRALLAQYRLAEKYEVALGVQGTDSYYGIIPLGGGTDEDDDVVIILNLDDETHARFDDSQIPGLFILELCKLLAGVVARNNHGPSVEYMIEIARKGLAITYETGPAWSDYEWLLRR